MIFMVAKSNILALAVIMLLITLRKQVVRVQETMVSTLTVRDLNSTVVDSSILLLRKYLRLILRIVISELLMPYRVVIIIVNYPTMPS